MDVKQMSFPSQFIIRIFAVCTGLLFWLFISSYFPVNSINALTTLATGILISAWLPLGSLAHLNRFSPSTTLVRVFLFLCLFSIVIFVVLPQGLFGLPIKSWILLVMIVSSCGLERVCIARSVKNKILWKFYLFSSVLRLFSLLCLAFFATDDATLIGIVAIVDSGIRLLTFILSYGRDTETKKPTAKTKKTLQSFKPWLAAAMQNSIYWFPISFGAFVSAQDIAVTRVQIFVLGFASVFYASDAVLSLRNYNRLGLVKSRLQIIAIGAIAILFSLIVWSEQTVLFAENLSLLSLDFPEYLILLLTILLLLLSWNGAKVVNFHSGAREWKLSLSLFMFSAGATLAKVNPIIVIFVTSCLWHLSVIFLYPHKQNNTSNLSQENQLHRKQEGE